ncbi:MAG: OmpH family outer membrane protein [Bacteroidales bacterium]|nr:OmpH family outer membrane protein [Bacteroidales bacterium]MBP5724887.1 OmpH family outer membrane protein [Bacteroidales bacterium]MBQ3676174.1 OmpH family outer membrane protein [Bacteroidales bacterium]MBR4498773.1 OmpH family outer membrane protein [Bacteroidales bacterium]MBR4689430.1 OmpH family outer membrane protein [Bacteroidales bacterium]
MKKLALFISGLLVAMMSYSQKTVYVDTDYLLSKIPAYKEAQQQIDELTKNWQAEIEEQRTALDNMYKQYQVDKVLLANDMKAKREQEILDKEKELKELQKKRFGANGDRIKKEEELIKPIQDEIFSAIKELASSQGYAFVIDAASSSYTLLYSDPKYDISDDVLRKLGYIK